MSNYKKEIDKRIIGPDKTQHNVPMAFDGLSGKIAKELPDGALTVEKIEPLEPQQVVVTETNGTLATSDITTTELGYLRGLEKNIVDTIHDIVNLRPNIYAVTFGYGGNAVTGRYLEKFSGTDVTEVPDIIPANGSIVALVLGAKDAIFDFTISVFKSTDLVNPILSYTILAGTDSAFILGLNIPLATGDKLLPKVTSGQRTKPILTYFINTSSL